MTECSEHFNIFLWARSENEYPRGEYKYFAKLRWEDDCTTICVYTDASITDVIMRCLKWCLPVLEHYDVQHDYPKEWCSSAEKFAESKYLEIIMNYSFLDIFPNGDHINITF